MGKALAVAAVLTVLAAEARAVDYVLDVKHTQIAFTAHPADPAKAAGKVHGRFTRFAGSFSYDTKASTAWKAQVDIDPTSIVMGIAEIAGPDKRPQHETLFDSVKCSTIAFNSTNITNVVEAKISTASAAGKVSAFNLNGDLTMRCETKPLTLDVKVGGVGVDPFGYGVANFTATATINRRDWGVDFFEKKPKKGRDLIGDKIDLLIQFTGKTKTAGPRPKRPAPAKKWPSNLTGGKKAPPK
jgi:polyisoprenoid-binding protein YceI